MPNKNPDACFRFRRPAWDVADCLAIRGECASVRVRPTMFRFPRWHPFLSGVFGWIAFTLLTAANAADSPVSPQLINKLEAARTETEQNEIIRTLKPAVSGDELRRQLLKHIYDLTLQGDYSRAMDDCELVLRLARAAGNEEDAAAARINLSFVLRESGDTAGSLGAIDQALEFYRSHPESVHGLISAHHSRGITYLAQSDFVHALESFQTALDLSRKIKYRDGIIPALNSIG